MLLARVVPSPRRTLRTQSIIGFPEAIHDSSNSISKVRHIEVDQQPHRQSRKLEIGKKLRRVHRVQSIDSLDLNENPMFDQVVDPETTL